MNEGDRMKNFDVNVKWKNIIIAQLIVDAEEVRYEPNIEGCQVASKKHGMIVKGINQSANCLPNWVRNRIPIKK